MVPTIPKQHNMLSCMKGIGDYVIYFNSGETSKWFKGGIRKKVYRVTGVNNTDLRLESRGTIFESRFSNVVRLKDIINYLLDNGINNYAQLTSYFAYNDDSLISQAYKAYNIGTLECSIRESDITEQELVEVDVKYNGWSEYTNSKKGKTMKNKVIDSNVEAAKMAAKITAGKALNKVLISKIKPHLPFGTKGYAEHMLAEVVVANIASFAVDNFAANNSKAVYAKEAMMQAAMVEFMSTFNIEKIIADVIGTVDIDLPKEEV